MAVQRRSGVVDMLVAPFVFALIIVMTYLGVLFGGMVAEKSADKSELFYDPQSMGEVIDAPCAVASRGVFYQSAVENGDFECFTPHNRISLTFRDVDGGPYTWVVERTDSGIEVRGDSAGPDNPQTYPVLVYDRDDGTTTPAVLEVDAG